jgi:hypothetical protein
MEYRFIIPTPLCCVDSSVPLRLRCPADLDAV